MSKEKQSAISDFFTISTLYEAFILKIMRLPLDEELRIKSAICELCISKKSETLNPSIRSYVKGYSEHHEINETEGIRNIISAMNIDLSSEYEDKKGNVKKLDLPGLVVPDDFSAMNLSGSVHSIGTHSPKYANASSQLEAVSHYRREEEDKANLIIQVNNAGLTRYAKFMSLELGSGKVFDTLFLTDRKDWSARSMETGNTDEARDLNLLSTLVSSSLGMDKSEVLDIFRQTSDIIKKRDRPSDNLSGVSKDGKAWTLPTIILPGEDGEDVQVSILTSHQAKNSVNNVKFQIKLVNKALKSIKNGPFTQNFMKLSPIKKKRGDDPFEHVDVIQAEMKDVEEAIDDILADYPDSLRNAVLPDHLSEMREQGLERRVLFLDEVKKNVNILDMLFLKTLNVYGQPQNSYVGAHGQVSLFGREPYLFYKKSRDLLADFMADKKGSYLPIDVTSILSSVKALMLLSFGNKDGMAGGELVKKNDERRIRSGKARRTAIATLHSALMNEVSQNILPLLHDMDDEQKNSFIERAFSSDGNTFRNALFKRLKHAMKNKKGVTDANDIKGLHLIMSDRDVITTLSDVNNHARRVLS